MADPFVCPSTTGPGPCKNDDPSHAGQAPKGCIHYTSDGSWVNDLSRPDGGHG